MSASKFVLLAAATAASCLPATSRAAENVTLSSIGASEMGALMDAWMRALHQAHPILTATRPVAQENRP